MRNLGILLLLGCAILGAFLLQLSIGQWTAAKVDYSIAVERTAAIDFNGRQYLDFSDLKRLRDLPTNIANKTELVRLNLSNTNITDLSSLVELKNLKFLSINNVPIKDLSPLAELTSLVDLSLARTWIFDLTPLSGLLRLEQLNLSHTAVRSLKPIVNLQRLEQLTLYSSYAHDGSKRQYAKLLNVVQRVNNGTAYRQGYKPGWLYRLQVWTKRLKQSWMVDRPKIP